MGIVYHQTADGSVIDLYRYIRRVHPQTSVIDTNEPKTGAFSGDNVYTADDTNEPESQTSKGLTNTKSGSDVKFHILMKTSRRHRCNKCYHSLSNKLGWRIARNKAPNVKLMCLECKKSYCLSCFKEVHF